ncbi:hypothetical protein PUN28_012950 [Cardiocondyla obscurior]|uniref:Uncharacterized protein n=1 Tax=Cardiocondyla obscurior TaxID=286306 RepID=A0AAW2F7F5_9HYME
MDARPPPVWSTFGEEKKKKKARAARGEHNVRNGERERKRDRARREEEGAEEEQGGGGAATRGIAERSRRTCKRSNEPRVLGTTYSLPALRGSYSAVIAELTPELYANKFNTHRKLQPRSRRRGEMR